MARKKLIRGGIHRHCPLPALPRRIRLPEIGHVLLYRTELEARETEFVDRRISSPEKSSPAPSRPTTAPWPWHSGSGNRSVAPGRLLRTEVSPATKASSPTPSGDESDVVLEGKTGSDGVFHAETLLAKCPSKYEGQSFEEMKKGYKK